MSQAAPVFYYNGYECRASWQADKICWLCRVDNVSIPFVFEAGDVREIQQLFEREVRAYIHRCEETGIPPRRSLMDSARGDRASAISQALRGQKKIREQREARKEREFQRSPWRFAVAGTLVGIPVLGYAMLASLGRVVPFTIFFPYRANIPQRRLPLLTLLVCLICWMIFTGQVLSESRYERDCDNFLSREAASEYAEIFSGCWELEYLRRSSQHPQHAMEDILYVSLDEGYGLEEEELAAIVDTVKDVLLSTLPEFEASVPPAFSHDMMYWPNRGDVSGAITSIFAHGDFGHILFNLIFFFAFAAAVERLAGHGFFLAVFAVTIVFNGVFDSHSEWGMGLELGVPSLGLSGVCSAFLGALLVLKHDVRIKTFFWFLVTIRTFLVPVWFLAAWYIGFDVMNMLEDDTIGGVGYLAHVTGAFSGIGCAVFYKYFLQKQVNVAALG